MKRLLYFFIFIGICSSSESQCSKGFNLEGEIRNIPDGTKIYLVQKATEDTISTTTVKNGKFNLIGTVEFSSDYFWLSLDTNVSKIPSSAIWIENSPMKIVSDLKNWPNVDVSGSNAHNHYMSTLHVFSKYMKSRDSLNRQKFELNKKLEKGGDDSLEAAKLILVIDDNISNARNAQFEEIANNIRSNPNSFFTPYLIITYKDFLDPAKIKEYYSLLTIPVRESLYGVKVKEYLNSQLIKTGDYLKNFVGKTPSNDSLEFFEILKKSKFVLIDFWASWCKPCRDENPELRRVFKAYHAKGFNILSITADSKHDKWVKAISQDSMVWSHVTDALGNGTMPGNFGISALPSYYLVDNKGKILYSDNPLQNTAGELRDGKLYLILKTLLE